MKPVTEWNESYIKQLPRGEFDWLEFKGRGALDFSLPSIEESKVLNKLSAQLSAMANSGGGTIVFGMTDPTDLSERQIDDGGISLTLKGRNTKEWLEDVIPNLVEFPIRHFSVIALTKDSGAPNVGEGRGIIIIHIPDSLDAPHQARDSKYYVRIGGKSHPAGHRIISDIFNRGNHAQFQVDFSMYSETWIPSSPFGLPSFGREKEPPRRSVFLTLTATNIGTVLAQFVRVFVFIPQQFTSGEDWNLDNLTVIDGGNYFEFGENNQKRDVVGNSSGYPKYGSSWFDPILPGLSQTWKFRLNSELTPEQIKNEVVHWSIHADSAPATEGHFDLSSISFDKRDTHEV